MIARLYAKWYRHRSVDPTDFDKHGSHVIVPDAAGIRRRYRSDACLYPGYPTYFDASGSSSMFERDVLVSSPSSGVDIK